jgi:aspartyl/asparaginyl-tRNA synthetase
MIEPETAFADLSDNASLAEGLLKYTFSALLKEREEDLAFFDERIEEGLVAKLEGIDREHYARYRDLRRYGTVPQPLPNPPPLAGEDPPPGSAKRPRGDIPTASD